MLCFINWGKYPLLSAACLGSWHVMQTEKMQIYVSITMYFLYILICHKKSYDYRPAGSKTCAWLDTTPKSLSPSVQLGDFSVARPPCETPVARVEPLEFGRRLRRVEVCVSIVSWRGLGAEASSSVHQMHFFLTERLLKLNTTSSICIQLYAYVSLCG